jgi:hypothetical protein
MDKNKKDHVLELIRRSLSLSIPENEIIATLVEANLAKEDAIKLLAEAKNNSKQIESEIKPISQMSDLSIGDQISKQLGLETTINNQTKKSVSQNDDAGDSNNFGLKIKSKENIEKKGLFSKFRKKEVEDLSSENKQNDLLNSSSKINLGGSDNINYDVDNDSSESALMDGLKKETNEQENNLNDVEKSGVEKNKIKEISSTKREFDEIVNKMSSKTMPDVKDKNFEELWKKGIVVAVNTKLSEMKKLKDEIDSLLNQKVDDAIKKETKQFRVLIDSQKNLIISSNKEALEQKQKEITFIIDSKISELKKQSSNLSSYVEIIEKSKQEQKQALDEIQQTLASAKKTKSQLLIEMNSELIKSKSSAQETIDKAQKKIDELESRINKTLEFEKNIAEGMLQDAEQKIERLTIDKADNLLEELEIELNKLKTIEKNINIDSVEQKIRVLDEFKKEFLNSMESNLEKINSAIEQLNEKNEQVSKELEEKSLAIDAKIEELTKFEKLFTDNLEKLITTKNKSTK